MVVFPEGTRLAPGERRAFRRGGAHLAKRTGRSVVPVAHNSGDYWPRRGFIKRPGTIRLAIGPAIDPAGGASAAEINRRAEEWIHERVASIRSGAPAARPARVAR